MSQNDDPMDQPMTKREFFRVLEPYNGAITSLTSCMISVSNALRLSGIEELQKEGQAVFDRIDKIIDHLEDASTQLSKVSGRGQDE